MKALVQILKRLCCPWLVENGTDFPFAVLVELTSCFDCIARSNFISATPYADYVDVYLDGNLVLSNYDGYSSSAFYQQLIYQNTSLTHGTRTIELYVTGNKDSSSGGTWDNLDYFEYQ